MVSAFVLVPGQSDNALGVELLLGGVVAIAVTAVPIVLMRSQLPTTLAFHARVVALTVAIALNLAAGVSLIVRRGGGLYLLLTGLLIAMVTNVSGAWSLLMGLAAED